MSILRLAGERGVLRQEKLFLTQNTLPIFDRLLDILEGIPGKISRRTASPFLYAGLATRYRKRSEPSCYPAGPSCASNVGRMVRA
jgi:hypothetical protein